MSQEKFESMLHIVRDSPHFDIAEYKVGDIYRIYAQISPSFLHFGDSIIARLKAVDVHSLTFETMQRCPIDESSDVYNRYMLHEFVLSIKLIIDQRIFIQHIIHMPSEEKENKSSKDKLSPDEVGSLLGCGKGAHDAYWSKIVPEAFPDIKNPTSSTEV